MTNIYCKELVHDPIHGNLKSMGGKLIWRIAYFFEVHEPTGKEVRNTSGNWESDDYEEEYECTYRKEVTEEEYGNRGDNNAN